MERETSRFPDLSVIYKAAGLTQAHVIKAKLEEAGVPVLLDYESAGPIIGISVDGLGQVRILVPKDRAEEARTLLEGE
jgi:hypothetical protein